MQNSEVYIRFSFQLIRNQELGIILSTTFCSIIKATKRKLSTNPIITLKCLVLLFDITTSTVKLQRKKPLLWIRTVQFWTGQINFFQIFLKTTLTQLLLTIDRDKAAVMHDSWHQPYIMFSIPILAKSVDTQEEWQLPSLKRKEKTLIISLETSRYAPLGRTIFVLIIFLLYKAHIMVFSPASRKQAFLSK